MKDIYDILREWKKRRGEVRQSVSDFALATLVRTEGSSYRRPGARMLICEDGATVGSLSAGCIEEEVATRAGEVIRTGEPARMSFDTRRRFGCAGKIDIIIERISESFFVDLTKHLDKRRSCIAVTRLEGDVKGTRIEVGAVHRTARGRLGQSPLPTETTALTQEIHPPIRLLIVGDGLDNAPIRSLGQLLGWEVIEIFDPNTISIPPDIWTAAIVKSHNYGRDFVALEKLLPLNLRYLGLIGPRKRRDELMNALLEAGITVNAGFFSPAGLELGAETPEEIALSIIAEIQRVFAGGTGESLRERKMPIHKISRQGGTRPSNALIH